MSIFANLDALRLSPESFGSVSTSEVLTHLAVRKPTRVEFFRVHPDPEMSFATGVYDDKQEREVYLVAPNMQATLLGETKPVLLRLTVNRDGNAFFWPLSLPNELGKRNRWTEPACLAAEQGKEYWTRAAADMSLGAYRVHKAKGELPDPVWPEKPLPELLELAFRNQVIDSPDHPVVRRLRGLV